MPIGPRFIRFGPVLRTPIPVHPARRARPGSTPIAPRWPEGPARGPVAATMPPGAADRPPSSGLSATPNRPGCGRFAAARRRGTRTPGPAAGAPLGRGRPVPKGFQGWSRRTAPKPCSPDRAGMSGAVRPLMAMPGVRRPPEAGGASDRRPRSPRCAWERFGPSSSRAPIRAPIAARAREGPSRGPSRRPCARGTVPSGVSRRPPPQRAPRPPASPPSPSAPSSPRSRATSASTASR